MLESQIQAKIIKRLESEGWYVVKLIRTNKNGIPDLVCLKGYESMFVEVKAPRGGLSALQKIRIEEIEKKGIKVLVLRE